MPRNKKIKILQISYIQKTNIKNWMKITIIKVIVTYNNLKDRQEM